MYVTKKLIDFLELSSQLANSSIILTNNTRVLFASSNADNNIYLNKKISKDLENIFLLYSSDSSSFNYINSTMDSVINLIINDDSSRYSSQIILPIMHNNLDGLLIFFTNNRKYIKSNLNFALTTRHFAELFSTRAYLD